MLQPLTDFYLCFMIPYVLNQGGIALLVSDSTCCLSTLLFWVQGLSGICEMILFFTKQYMELEWVPSQMYP